MPNKDKIQRKKDSQNDEIIYTFSNGDIYTGTVKNGKFCGKGDYLAVNGDHYTGSFVSGMISGFGKAVFENNTFVDIYEGQWVGGLATGEGKATLTGFGDRYEGFFTFGKFHGQGSLFYHNGDAYEGRFENGIPSGDGKMLFREAKVIINRNFNSRGIDRASTGDL